MRIVLVSAVALAALAQAASAQEPVQVPRGANTPDGLECRIAMAAARDYAPGEAVNVWPTLWVEAGDHRWPLDCQGYFRAMGQLDHRLMTAGDSLNISRPELSSPTSATLLVDASLGRTFKSRTRYTLALEEGQWRVTGRAEETVTPAISGLT